MITATATFFPGDTPDVIRCHIIATDESGEIASVEILDQNGIRLFLDEIPDCGSRYDDTVVISQRRLPITLRVRRCISGTESSFGPFFNPGSGVVPCDPAAGIPPTPTCARTLEEIERIHRRIDDTCAEITYWNASVSTFAIIAAVWHAIAAVLIAAAGIASFFGPLGAAWAAGFLFAAAAAALFEALALAALAGALIQRDSARREDRTLRVSEGLFVDEARRVCCPHEVAGVELHPPCAG